MWLVPIEAEKGSHRNGKRRRTYQVRKVRPVADLSSTNQNRAQTTPKVVKGVTKLSSCSKRKNKVNRPLCYHFGMSPRLGKEKTLSLAKIYNLSWRLATHTRLHTQELQTKINLCYIRYIDMFNRYN